ncbi:DUF349 domain-containing protein [Dokdonia sp. Hel_I_53]|uniref:DUF349 domain-containing protein n=1 Tax=Dokdonia sp. Hel_I_53 TaxID=1566287 RepID=UPI00119A0D50|nr:DUF349 domain-containing protein [Dokdonia sp. Hel_I_53]TVZ50932.1 uncharacterized protein DUF349 [Dokdonia sp. Hel_I_53]
MSEENKSQDSKEVEKIERAEAGNENISKDIAAQDAAGTVNEEVSIDPNEDKTATAIIEESEGIAPLDITSQENVNDKEEEEKVEVKEIEKKDYTVLSKEELIKELQHLIKNEKVIDIKDQAEEINSVINAQFDAEQEEAKASFLKEGGNVIDFRFYSPLKKDFNEVYYEYRNKRQEFFERKRKDQNANLIERQNIIEDIKALRDELGGAESVNTTFNKFKEIQERWNNAGNIPRDRYNLVWNDYYFHVDAFYELLHLNREFRDKHFEDNLVKKIQLIQRAEELSTETNINKAFKELQLLHRMWKEEIGPVSKQYSDEIWDQFSAATKKIHDARDEKQKEIEAVWEKNFEEKQQVIAQILEVAQDDIKAHKTVQEKIKKVEALRDTFFKTGKVPRDKNEETWSAFKEATKLFNKKKNNFYKSQKKEQYDNLEAKKALVKIAQENKDNEDIPATLDIMKRIQAEWKTIGHVPRKDSDKIWNEFKSACNNFFDRMKDSKKQDRAGEQENYEKKVALMQTLKDVNLTGDRTTDLASIKEYIARWKSIGRVPYAKKNIDQDFNKILDSFFKKLDIDRKEAELIKYENRMQTMADADNERAIEKERFFIRKKIDEVKSEINQLENNLGFFQHVADDNPMVMEVHKNINRHKDDLALWKSKLKKLRTVVAESQKEEESQESQEKEVDDTSEE